VVPGGPHHIRQRGINRQDVRSVDDDRHVYLALLKTAASVSIMEAELEHSGHNTISINGS
jgi:hypothetical protein